MNNNVFWETLKKLIITGLLIFLSIRIVTAIVINNKQKQLEKESKNIINNQSLFTTIDKEQEEKIQKEMEKLKQKYQ